MRIKPMHAIVVALIGVVLVLFALHSMNRIANAKSTVNSVSRHMSHNRVGRMAGGEMQREAGQYDTEVMWCLIGGIILIVAGGGTLYYLKRR